MSLWHAASSLWYSLAGFESTNFCMMASAFWNSCSASSGFPVSDGSAPPMWLWHVARSLWNSGTARLASASFCMISSAVWNF